jgi:acyl dehydratase
MSPAAKPGGKRGSKGVKPAKQGTDPPAKPAPGAKAAVDPGPLKVGTEATDRVLLDEDSVRGFGEAVGDLNPIHFSLDFAAKTRYGRPIVHGTFLLGLLGRIMGTRMPGPGTIYLEHRVSFRKAVPVGTMVLLRVRVKEVRPRDRYLLETVVLDDAGATCVEGEAVVWLPREGL